LQELNSDKRFSIPIIFEFSKFLEPTSICLVSITLTVLPLGYGNIIDMDAELVVPNTTLSVYENAIFPWRGESMSWFRDELVNNAYRFDFPIHKPFIN
jgi:excinuclease ABC subunit A